jgi:adenylate cyclase
VYSLLAAIAVLDGDMDLARKNIEKMIEVNPAANVSSLKRVLYFLKDQAFLNRYLDALRKAGLPEKPPLKLPDKPSIAVLPFDNLSNDPEQEYFADGMAEDIITDLSKISGLFVIARNSSFSYKGKQTEVRTIARELGVKYILEGSVRRAGDQVRINAQLIDATTGGHLWAERYDGSATDVFAVQDRITEAIVQSLKVTLTGAEQGRLGKKPTDDPLAYDLYLRARAAYVRFDEDGLHEALRLFKEAHEQDPTFADAYARRAQAAYVIFNLGFASSELREIAESLSARALELDSGNGLAMAVQAQFAQWAEDGHDRAIELARSAVHIDPGNAEVRMILAIGYAHADRFEEARREISLAIRLAPAPDAYLSFLLGWGLLLAGDYAKAVGFLEKARDGIPNSPWNRGGLAAAYAGAGNRVDAISELDVYLRFEGLAGRSVRGFEAAFRHWAPKVRNNLLDAFRKAGLPEWPHGFDGKEEDRLVEQDIRDLVFGQTRIGSTSAGGEYEVDIGLDGMAEWRQGGGAFSAEYWLEGDALCYKFRGLFSGRAMCGSVFRNPGGKYDSKDQYVFVDPLDLAYFSIKR